ncbi:MAG: phosphonate ABC transporter, permease protein PhnE [Rhizobiales bacterium]|nr:phosphonate ABC transporter, permease protein PhnE [Hyphomicrobiales bacterium]
MTAVSFETAVSAGLAREAQVRHRRYIKQAVWGAIAIAVLWYAAHQIKFSPYAVAAGVPFMWDFLTRLFPPDLSYMSVLGSATIETIQIAIWGTLLAIILSIPFSLLGARNTTPHIIVFHATRVFLNALRAINELVFALIFVSAVGLGPFAGVLAIALHATGMLAKFVAEEIESVDKGQIEAQLSTGASRMQVILFGVIPQVIPSFVGYSIYRLDVSIRSATVLGLVGAGGLGFSLIQTMKLFKYHQTATCILVIFLLVLVSDWICGKLRRKVI